MLPEEVLHERKEHPARRGHPGACVCSSPSVSTLEQASRRVRVAQPRSMEGARLTLVEFIIQSLDVDVQLRREKVYAQGPSQMVYRERYPKEKAEAGDNQNTTTEVCERDPGTVRSTAGARRPWLNAQDHLDENTRHFNTEPETGANP